MHIATDLGTNMHCTLAFINCSYYYIIYTVHHCTLKRLSKVYYSTFYMFAHRLRIYTTSPWWIECTLTFCVVGALPFISPSNKGTIVMALSKNFFTSSLLHSVGVSSSHSHHAPPSIPWSTHNLLGYTAPCFTACMCISMQSHIQQWQMKHMQCIAIGDNYMRSTQTVAMLWAHAYNGINSQSINACTCKNYTEWLKYTL